MAEQDGYNFQQLKRGILALSVSPDWETAKKEWKLTSMYEVDEPDTCLCGHSPIIEICVLTNILNGKVAEVGNRCVKRFLGLRSDLIFTGVKRAKADITKGLNPDATLFFYERKVLTQADYDFQADTWRKRDLSPKQMKWRQDINRRVLSFFERRGI